MNKDEYLRLMKQVIDESIKDDEKIQQFLVWLYEKTASLASPYQESALRAFYCSVVEGTITNVNREISRMLDSRLDKDIDEVREVANQLRESEYNGIPFREIPRSRFTQREIIRLIDKVIRSPAVDIVVDRNLAIECKRQNKQGIIYLLQATALLVRETDKDFQRSMIGFIHIFHDQETRGVHLQERHIKSLQNQLIWCLYKEQNLKLDWQFSDEQKQLLNNYYAANKLLVDCLQASNASLEMQKEIQDTLLLPIVEIERRKSGINKKIILNFSQETNATPEVQDTQETLLLPTVKIEKRSSNEVQQQVQKTLALSIDETAQHELENKQISQKLLVKNNFYLTTMFYGSLLMALILYLVFIIVFRHYI